MSPTALPKEPMKHLNLNLIAAIALLVGLVIATAPVSAQNTNGNADANQFRNPATAVPNGGSSRAIGPSATPAAPQAAPVGGQSEIYTGIAPCRIFDTRSTAAMAVGVNRHFQVTGNLAAQAGSNTCGIPSYATSVAINLTGIAINGPSFVRGWAFNGAEPNATLLGISPAINAINMLNIPLCRGAGCTNAFTLKAFQNNTHLVGDVVGYYTQPLYATVLAGGIYEGSPSSGALSASNPQTGYYFVKFIRPVSNCSAQVSEFIFSINLFIKADTGLSGISFGDSVVGEDEVVVVVRNQAGNLTNSGGFHLRLTC